MIQDFHIARITNLTGSILGRQRTKCEMGAIDITQGEEGPGISGVFNHNTRHMLNNIRGIIVMSYEGLL
jgi:hypothetical protein